MKTYFKELHTQALESMVRETGYNVSVLRDCGKNGQVYSRAMCLYTEACEILRTWCTAIQAAQRAEDLITRTYNPEGCSMSIPVDTRDKIFDAMHAFLQMTVLFHSAGPWDERKRNEWIKLETIILRLPSAHRMSLRYATGEVTTKALCDYARIILG